MSKLPVSGDYSAITTIGAPSDPCSNTASMFDCGYVENSVSAIDLFIENCKEMNKLLYAAGGTLSPEYSRLLLLGYVSAVESFFRTILRSIVNTDADVRENAHSLLVPFGAVLYHDKKIIAEALLEGYSFAGQQDLKKAILKLLGVSVPAELLPMLDSYEKICQLRHCCVHRFGKLGTQNGIVLGLEQHSKALEKPLALDHRQLEEIASWLMSFAKAMNNFMFTASLDRSVSKDNRHRVNWSWNYAKDRSKFQKVYRLFNTNADTAPSPSAEELYGRFKSVMQLRENKGRAAKKKK